MSRNKHRSTATTAMTTITPTDSTGPSDDDPPLLFMGLVVAVVVALVVGVAVDVDVGVFDNGVGGEGDVMVGSPGEGDEGVGVGDDGTALGVG